MTNLIGQSLGRYQILEQLGEGGMATVYKAYDTRLKTEVAVKVIRTDVFAPIVLKRVLKRFEREARALAKLNHPNIIKITEYGNQAGRPYLVMVYLPGGTLRTLLGQPIYWVKACKLLLPIAHALDYAHHQGLIHRDVKPSNILLTHQGQPMLTDFGIAKILEADETTSLTGTGMGVGTPEYMAPEQWTGEAVVQSDQYSLGIILYEMLTGRKPYTGNTPAAILLKQATESIPRPKRFAPDTPDTLEKILAKALDKKPENRFPEMAAFADALEALLPVSPQKAPQVNPASPLKTESDATIDLLGTQAPIPAPKMPVGLPPANLQNRQKTAQTSASLPRPRQIPTGWLVKLAFSGLFLIVLTLGVIGLIFLRNHVLAAPPQLVNSPLSLKISTPSTLVSHVTMTPRPTALQAPTLTSFPSRTPAPSITPLPTNTLMPSLTPMSINTLNPTATQASVLEPGTSHMREVDGMIILFIPAGPFTMGSSYDYKEKPAHTVTLDAYWMDKTEITNALYAKCVGSGKCQTPTSLSSATRKNYYGDAQYANYPVIYVNWIMAKTYCEWAGARLPTSAEWEKGARGTDARLYPWGNAYDKTRANFRGTDTVAVSSYENGKSPYGLYDMAGNVWEWVSDWCDEGDYYRNSPASNPQGPATGICKRIRGASWGNVISFTRSSSFQSQLPNYSDYYTGFRCAMKANP